jgi:hypothetical protein
MKLLTYSYNKDVFDYCTKREVPRRRRGNTFMMGCRVKNMDNAQGGASLTSVYSMQREYERRTPAGKNIT